MDRRKRRDIWDRDFDPFPRRRFDDIFKDFDEEFERMREYMDEMLRKVINGEIPDPHEGGPFVYGFSMRVGPDGKPTIHEFGNTGQLFGKDAPKIAPRKPLTDIIESKDEVFITVEMPGVEKDDIELNVSDDSVTIRVDVPQRKYYNEIPLPCDIEPDSAKATYKNGVLDITLKKKEKEQLKGKRVKID